MLSEKNFVEGRSFRFFKARRNYGLISIIVDFLNLKEKTNFMYLNKAFGKAALNSKELLVS